MEGAKDGSAVQLGKHESAVVQIVAKESNSYEAASSSQNGTCTKATSKTADASKTTEDKVPDTLRQALRKLVLLSQNAVLYCSVLPLYQVPLAIQRLHIQGYSMFFILGPCHCQILSDFTSIHPHAATPNNCCKPRQQHSNIGTMHV